MTATIQPHSSNAEIIELASKVCEVNSIPFSANDANQALADVGNSFEVQDCQLLDAIGQRIGVRFRQVEGSLRDLLLSAIEVSPIIVGRKDAHSPERNGYFIVLRRTSQSKFEVFIDGQEQTVSPRWHRAIRCAVFDDASNVFDLDYVFPILVRQVGTDQPFPGHSVACCAIRRIGGTSRLDLLHIRHESGERGLVDAERRVGRLVSVPNVLQLRLGLAQVFLVRGNEVEDVYAQNVDRREYHGRPEQPEPPARHRVVVFPDAVIAMSLDGLIMGFALGGRGRFRRAVWHDDGWFEA